MPTLFARRSKGPSSNGLSSLRFNQHQPVSSADLLQSAAGDQDARPLPPVPFELPPQGTDYSIPSHNSFKMHEFGALPPPRDIDEKPLPLPAPQQQQQRTARSMTSRSTMPIASLRPAVSAATISAGGPPTRAKTRSSMASGYSTGITHSGFGHLSGRASLEHVEPYSYGYCHASLDAQVDIAVVVQLVGALGEQIRQRGLDSPLIFSSMALDVSASNTCSLIRSFMSSHSAAAASSRSRGMPPSALPAAFLSEIRFANPHDLAAMLKWALARLGRVFAVPVPAVPGEGPNRKGVVEEDTIFVQQRGFLQLDAYLSWREDERTRQFPVTAFTSFVDAVMDPAAAALLRALLSLLSSTAAYSLKNGMTPSKLARLFGPLIFGLPEDETFERTYDAFVRASNATEHLLLAYIRDASSIESLPVRLNDHLRGYPSMLSSDISRPARHVRGVPVTQIERVVRLYSADLVQSACELDLSATCEEWAACCSTQESLGREPQLSDRYRKLLNFRGSAVHARRSEASNGAGSSLLVRQLSSHSNGRSTESELETHGSLASKTWSDFSLDGFAAPDKSKLAFDLRESERKARIENRGAVKWSQFEETGFVATDEGLREVLSFDDGLQEDMARWPGERAQMLEKIRAQASKLPPFPYDTAPHCVASPLRGEISTLGAGQWNETPISRMDEMFPEVVADFLLGNGWSNRDELTHRNANFVVVQYKSRAAPEVQEASADSTLGDQSLLSRNVEAPVDDRTKAAWFIVQELVPSQYRADLDAAGRHKGRSKPSLRKLNIFKRVRRERDENQPADPHDPFTAGAGGATRHLRIHGPTSPALSSNGAMAADLERAGTYASFRTQTQRRTDAGVPPGMTYEPGPDFMETSSSSILHSLRSKTKRGRGRGADEAALPSAPPQQGIAHTQYDSFSSSDFETRSLHDPELDELTASDDYTVRRKNPLARRHERRESKDDAWIDVLSKANGFRMAGQDADVSPMRKGTRQQLASASEPGPSRAALPNLQLPPRDASLNDSLRNTPTQETFNEDARQSTAAQAVICDAAPATGVVPPAAAIAAAGWSLEPAPEPERRNMLRPAVPERRSSSISEDASGSSSRPMDLTPPAAAPVPLPPSEPRQHAPVLPAPALRPVDSPDRSQSVTPVAGKTSPPPAPASAAAPTSTTKEPPAVPSPDVSPVAVRRIVPPIPGPGATAAEKELARAARIEAAKERARELRAGLKDVRPLPVEPKEAAEARPAPSPATNRSDPFSKNPTSGRVAAIAGKFGGPAKARLGSMSPTNGQPTSLPALSAVASSEPASPSPVRAGLPSALLSGLPAQALSSVSSPVSAPQPEPKIAQPMAGWTATADAGAKGPAPAAQGWTLADPEAPPSPRTRESLDSVLPDSDSIYPDDAASNYSRSTDDGGEPGGRSSAFFASRPDSMLSENGFAADALRSEEEDRAMELRREPYQPGMPLDNVAEESESMLSGSNGR